MHICRIIFLLLFSMLFPGCLISTQSFNHGKLLNPGERLFSAGFGWKYASRYFYQDTWYDSLNNKEIPIFDTARYNWAAFVIDYRSGVLRKYPFGRGLEIGYHLETALRMKRVIEKRYSCDEDCRVAYDTSYESELHSPPLLEIETRFGFPDRTLEKCIFHHNLCLGWITGQYVDNGWFAGYAAGWEFWRIIPYVNIKLFCTATDKMNEAWWDDSTFFKQHDRKFVMRISGGTSFILPYNHTLLPEFISPEVSLMFPNFSIGQPVGVSFSTGIRWMLGR
jgi:hypothetical protein